MKIKLVDMPEVPKSILVPKEVYDNLDKLDYVRNSVELESSIDNKFLCIHASTKLSNSGYHITPNKYSIYIPIDIMEWHDKESNTIIMPNVFKSINVNGYRFIVNTEIPELSKYFHDVFTCDYYIKGEVGFINDTRDIDLIFGTDYAMITLHKNGDLLHDLSYRSKFNILDQFLNDEYKFRLTI